MRKHDCKNPNFCPYCRQKVKKDIVDFFKNNPKILFSYNDIMNEFKLQYITTAKILNALERKNIISRKYISNKRLNIGSGIDVRFTYIRNIYRPYKV